MTRSKILPTEQRFRSPVTDSTQVPACGMTRVMIAADVAAWVGGSVGGCCGSVFRADTLSLPLSHVPPRNALTARERSRALERRGARTSTEFAPKSAIGKFQEKSGTTLTDKSARAHPARDQAAHARRGRVPRRAIGAQSPAARLRQIAGAAWSTKRYLNIELLRDQRMRGAITA